MIDGLRPYAEMKPTGLPWLGDVPAHWDVRKLGRIGRFFKGSGGTKDDALPVGIPCVRYGDLYTTHSFFVRKARTYLSEERAKDYTAIQFGDVLFAASGETIEDIGKSAVNLLKGEVRCGGDTIVLRPGHDAYPAFLGYAADCNPSAVQKAMMGRGTTIKHIYPGALKQLLLVVPPLDEQRLIVRFLDWHGGQVARLVRAKKTLIGLLNEQKQAIIHRAVTRGLDANAKLKPSGIPWLGDVPGGWEVMPIKRVASFKSGAGFPVGERGANGKEVPFLKVSDMTLQGNERSIVSWNNSISRDTAAKLGAYVFPAQTIIFPKVGGAMLTNKRRIHIQDSCIDNNVMGCVVQHADFDYIFLTLEQIDFGKISKPGPVPAIGEGEVREIKVALPQLNEQRKIVVWLNNECSELDRSISLVTSEVALIQEFRTRMIADVVTGKLDVRALAAGLPETAEQEASLDQSDDEDLDDLPDDLEPEEAAA